MKHPSNKKEFYLEEYEKLLEKHEKAISFIEMAACGARPDGTYNYSREALEKIAKLLLKNIK